MANLPYAVATPVIVEPAGQRLGARQHDGDDSERARRSDHGSAVDEDYSALSVWMQSQCRIELVRVMPPSVFWPRPKVNSAILNIMVDEELRGRIPDRAYFHEFVRSMFFHRRKFLRSELASAFKGRLTKSDADEIMAVAELGPTTRAEELDVETMLRLCEVVRARLPATT